MRPELILPVHDLEPTGRAFRAPLGQAWLRAALEGSEMSPAGEDGEVDVEVSKLGSDVLVRGGVRARLVVPCARCLEPVRLDVRASLGLLLRQVRLAAGDRFPERPSATGRPGDRATPAARRTGRDRTAGGSARDDGRGSRPGDRDDTGEDTYEGHEVVLDPYVREALVLEAPTFPLCSGDCPGISVPSEAGPVASTAAPGAREAALPWRRLRRHGHKWRPGR